MTNTFYIGIQVIALRKVYYEGGSHDNIVQEYELCKELVN